MSYSETYAVPARDDLEAWIDLLREARWSDFETVLHIHSRLHQVFGDSPSDAVLQGERELSNLLRSVGIEHRHQDELSRKAGTLVENPRPATIEELQYYLPHMDVHTGLIQLVSDVDEGGVFIKIDEGVLPENLRSAALRRINRAMPPGVMLEQPPSDAPGDFARVAAVYNLQLRPRWGSVEVVPWDQLLTTAPSAVLKAGKLNLNVKIAQRQTTLVKSAESLVESPERFVLGAALVPNEEDQQGHIYSEAEVRTACHWWAEHNASFALQHVLLGGRPAEPGEIVMLENYVLPAECKVGEETYPAGTWFVGAGVRSDEAWSQFADGKLSSWSIGAEAYVAEEAAPN